MRGTVVAMWTLAVFFLGAICTGCAGIMSPEQQQVASQALSDMLAAGQITPEQYQALLQAMNTQASNIDWGALGGTALISVLSSLGIIRGWRGGVNNRKGATAPASPGAQP